MHPQQQFGLVHRVLGAVRVGSGERLVDLAHAAPRAFRLAVVPNVRVSMNILVRLSLAQASTGSVMVAAFCNVPRIMADAVPAGTARGQPPPT